MSYVKCTNCKGTGLVPALNGSKRWEKCPKCKGLGKKLIKGGESNVRSKTKRSSN